MSEPRTAVEAMRAALLMLLQSQPRALAAEQVIRWLEQDGFTVSRIEEEATRADPGLDPERFAKAFLNVTRRRLPALIPEWEDIESEARAKAFADAVEIAVEYRRLSEEPLGVLPSTESPHE